MKTDIWMPLYVKDYLASTSRLSTIEHGAYLLLLMDYWINGALPNDNSVLLQITKLDKDNLWVINGLLSRFFYLDEESNTYKNLRIEVEREKATHNRKVAVTNGKKGGRPKNPRVNPEETSSSAPTPITKSLKTPVSIEKITELNQIFNREDAESYVNGLVNKLDDFGIEAFQKVKFTGQDIIDNSLEVFKDNLQIVINKHKKSVKKKISGNYLDGEGNTVDGNTHEIIEEKK